MSIKKIVLRIKRMFSSAGDTSKLSGSIKFFDRKKRFGFIVSDKNEYFFHAAATKPEEFKLLQDGAKVRFIVVTGKKGPQADQVEVVRD